MLFLHMGGEWRLLGEIMIGIVWIMGLALDGYGCGWRVMVVGDGMGYYYNGEIYDFLWFR